MAYISDIVDAISSPYAQWRRVRGVEPLLDKDGRALYTTGNAAVCFRVRHEGRNKLLKCYTRTHPALPTIYGDEYHPRELCVLSLTSERVWVDCLLTDYIEGITLDEALSLAVTPEDVAPLAEAFDIMAATLLEREYAHGDLKPENIILRPDGALQPIDWDASYTPQLEGRCAAEIGTAAYQHPLRNEEFYDKHIDDYSIAQLSTLLHSAAIDPASLQHYQTLHEPSLRPYDNIGTTKVSDGLKRLLDLFAQRAMACQYRIALQLSSPIPQLFDLRELLSSDPFPTEALPSPKEQSSAQEASVCYSLEERGGLWGVCSLTNGERSWLIPPLYDWGFEPSDGCALLGLGTYSHFIALDGTLLASFDGSYRVKPFRNGVATLLHYDGQMWKSELLEISSILQNRKK